MKSLFSIAFLCLTAGSAFAQKQSEQLPYNKTQLDSMFRTYPKMNQPFTVPAPKEYSFPETAIPGVSTEFERMNPGVTVINKTNKGTIYNMPLDNMAVLVPDINQTERMPGSGIFRLAPESKMPNPLYLGNKQKKLIPKKP